MLDNQLNLAFWFLNVIQHITHILYCPIFWSRRSECSYMDINDRYWWQFALMTCLRPSSRKGQHQNYLATMSKNWWQNMEHNHSLVTDLFISRFEITMVLKNRILNSWAIFSFLETRCCWSTSFVSDWLNWLRAAWSCLRLLDVNRMVAGDISQSVLRKIFEKFQKI